MLLGASNTDPRTGETWYKPEVRLRLNPTDGKDGDDFN
jgi:hypothetical protein